MHGMRIDAAVGHFIVQSAQVRLKDAKLAWFAAAPRDVDEDDRRIVVLQGERQVVSANAEIDDAQLGGQRSLGQSARHFTAKGVVAANETADSGDAKAGHPQPSGPM